MLNQTVRPGIILYNVIQKRFGSLFLAAVTKMFYVVVTWCEKVDDGWKTVYL